MLLLGLWACIFPLAFAGPMCAPTDRGFIAGASGDAFQVDATSPIEFVPDHTPRIPAIPSASGTPFRSQS
jgi:hypothetical protein